MKKRCLIFITIALCGIFFVSCVSTINYRDMDLVIENDSQQILNLKYYGDDDEDFIRQSERLMKNGFLDTSSEEYGYYYISYSSERIDTTGFGNTINETFRLSADLFSRTGTAIIISFTYPLIFLSHPLMSLIFPPALVLMFTGGLVIGTGGIVLSAIAPPMLLLGVPSETARFRITVDMYIFDSNGEMVRYFEKSGDFRQTAGLYYGHDPTKKAAGAFSGLFEELFQTANVESDEINQALRAAGPITEENKDQAMKNINAYFK